MDKAEGVWDRNIEPYEQKINKALSRYDTLKAWVDINLDRTVGRVWFEMNRIDFLASEAKKVVDAAFEAPNVLRDLTIKESFTRKPDYG